MIQARHRNLGSGWGSLYLLAVGLAGVLGAHESYGAVPQALPFKKVLFITFENTDYEGAMAQPFIQKLAREGAALADMNAEAHPSQANYFAMTGGSLFGIMGDGTVNVSARHIGDLLEEQGKSWRAYAEDYPGNCYLGARSGAYARKHMPFISYRDVQTDLARCNRVVVNSSAFAADIQSGNLPDYSYYVPNLNNDGHDTSVAYADRWLSQTMGPLLANPAFMKDMLFVLTFDESEGYGTNHIATIVYGPGVSPGSVATAHYSHYDLLRTIEEGLGVGTLGANDVSAQVITGIWK